MTKQISFLFFLFFSQLCAAQDTTLAYYLFTEGTYDINFWEDEQNYERSNIGYNFGANIGFGKQKNKLGLAVFGGVFQQEFLETNPIEDLHPRKTKYRYFTSSIANIGLETNYLIYTNNRFSIATGLRGIYSKFYKSIGYKVVDGIESGTKGWDVNKVEYRLGVQSFLRFKKAFKNQWVYASIGHQSILKALNPEQIPTATTLPNNSKTAICFQFAYGIDLYKPKP